MKISKLYLTVVTGLLISLLQTAVAQDLDLSQTPQVARLENNAPKRILFVGNSYFYYNDSLHNHVVRIAGEIGPFEEDEYEYKSATIGGARLSHHNIDSLLEPGRLGIDEPFDLVILQGGSGEVASANSRARFRQSVIEMSEKIRATGAEVALYMTHAYVEANDRYEPNMLVNKISPTYLSVGNEIGSLVIPVGLAFEKAYEKRPEIVLHKTFDGTHPSLLGTYLAACVVVQSVYGGSTVGIDYDYFGEIDKDDARFLQEVADETVREFFGRE